MGLAFDTVSLNGTEAKARGIPQSSFESLTAILEQVSPLFRQAFAAALSLRLSALARTQNESEERGDSNAI